MGDTYVFIDAGYLREDYHKAIRNFFRVDGEIDYVAVKQGLGAVKAFYYDCLKHNEETFNRIRSLSGYHVRLGTLRGKGQKKRQKQVDVQLATEMLTHAFQKNMEKAALLSGDLDFKPVVDSLANRGAHISVCCEEASGSKDLYWAADTWMEIKLNMWHAWSTKVFQHKWLFGPYCDPLNL